MHVGDDIGAANGELDDYKGDGGHGGDRGWEACHGGGWEAYRIDGELMVLVALNTYTTRMWLSASRQWVGK